MKRDHLEQVLAARTEKRPIAVVTRLADGAQSLCDGTTWKGDVALNTEQLAEARALLVAGRSAALEASKGEIFVRSYAPPPKMVIVGAVHIAQFLAPMAALAGFQVIVVDPRKAFATEARFPGVSLVTEWPESALAQVGLDDHTAVVTLTHDPKLDDPALQAALKSRAFYIGALNVSPFGEDDYHVVGSIAGQALRLQASSFS